MNSFSRYLSSFWKGLWSLLVGMSTTLKIFFRKKTTETYPDNRKTLYISPRFRGCLQMVLDQDGKHRCIACGLCQTNCPNNTIKLQIGNETTAEGKTKKVLLHYEYDLGSCLFCQLCVKVCPQDAIEFAPEFENAVFNRGKLVLTLNPNANTEAQALSGSNSVKEGKTQNIEI